jgi:hypothetical protein
VCVCVCVCVCDILFVERLSKLEVRQYDGRLVTILLAIVVVVVVLEKMHV